MTMKKATNHQKADCQKTQKILVVLVQKERFDEYSNDIIFIKPRVNVNTMTLKFTASYKSSSFVQQAYYEVHNRIPNEKKVKYIQNSREVAIQFAEKGWNHTQPG